MVVCFKAGSGNGKSNLPPICPLPRGGGLGWGQQTTRSATKPVCLPSIYIHQERSGVCKQGSEQTAGTPAITLPPPQPSPAALRCGGGSRTANDLTTVRPFFHRTAPPLQGEARSGGGPGGGGERCCLLHGCSIFFTDIPRKLSQGGACPTVIAHQTARLAPICPLPLWGRAGVGAARIPCC